MAVDPDGLGIKVTRHTPHSVLVLVLTLRVVLAVNGLCHALVLVYCLSSKYGTQFRIKGQRLLHDPKATFLLGAPTEF